MKYIPLFSVCFVVFALLGFICTYLPMDTNSKNPFDWRYAIAVIPVALEKTPANVIVKVIAVMSGYQVGVWAAQGVQGKPLSLSTFPTPTPTPRPNWDELIPKTSDLNPLWERLATPTPNLLDSDTLKRLHLFTTPTAAATPVP
jgi:hypothetical protein